MPEKKNIYIYMFFHPRIIVNPDHRGQPEDEKDTFGQFIAWKKVFQL